MPCFKTFSFSVVNFPPFNSTITLLLTYTILRPGPLNSKILSNLFAEKLMNILNTQVKTARINNHHIAISKMALKFFFDAFARVKANTLAFRVLLIFEEALKILSSPSN